MPTEEDTSAGTAMVLSPQSFMELLQRAAIDPNVDVGKMQALADLGLKLQAARAEAIFKHEFADLRGKLPIILEHGIADFGGTDKRPYALYEDMVEITQPILAEHGFAVSFRTRNDNDKEVTVTGVLSHAAGHDVEASLKFPADTGGKKNPVQALASAISYAERHLLKALLGLATRHEDDDGKGGDRPAPQVITEAQVLEIEGLITQAKVERGPFLTWLRAEIDANGIDEIPAKSFERVCKVLRGKIAPMDAAKQELRDRQAAAQPKPTPEPERQPEPEEGPGEPGLDDDRIASPAEPTPQPMETPPAGCNHEKIAGRVGPQTCPDCNTACNTAQIRAGEGRAAKGKR